jgi:hypothetical protein
MKKRELAKYVMPRGHYVVNQKAPVFADRRTKRLRTRGAQKRAAINE